MSDHAERMKVSAWLREWRLQREMEADDAAPGPAPRVGPGGGGAWRQAAEPRRPSRTGLRAGTILLLRPVTPLTANRPAYVAVLAPGQSAGWWRVAPFGRFATPATPGEVETGLKAPRLRVLCLWNGHDVSGGRLLMWAWPVGRMTQDQLASALEAGGARRGPRLVHPLDPRHAYLDEERTLWPDWERAAGGADTPAAGEAGEDPWRGARAAESPGEPYA